MRNKPETKGWTPLVFLILLLTTIISIVLVFMFRHIINIEGALLYIVLILPGSFVLWILTMVVSVLFGMIVKALNQPESSGNVFGVICWLTGIMHFIVYLRLETPIFSKIIIELMIFGFWWNLSKIGFKMNEKLKK